MTNITINSEYDPELAGPEMQFSPLALAAFCFGLLSVFALVSVKMSILGVLAVILGFLPLISANRWNLSSRSIMLALIATSCGLCFTCWSFARQQLFNQRLERQAITFALDYFEILKRGDLDLAFRMGMDLDRLDNAEKEDPSMYNTVEAAQITRSGFVNNPARREVTDRGALGDWQFVRSTGVRKEAQGYFVRLVFQDKSKSNPRSVAIMMMRENARKDETKMYYWSIAGMELEDQA